MPNLLNISTNPSKHLKDHLATILIASFVVGMLSAVQPVFAAHNENLFVSAENPQFENYFTGASVIEVVVVDPNISSTNAGRGEPDVTVNGNKLRMVQATDGNWYGYFADRQMAQYADETVRSSGVAGSGLDFGVFCNGSNTFSILGVGFTETAAVAIPRSDGLVGYTNGIDPIQSCSGSVSSGTKLNHVVREPPSLNTDPAVFPGQINLDSDAWPIIQLYNFNPTGNVVVQYNKGDGTQYTTLKFDTSSQFANHLLFQSAYRPQHQIKLDLIDVQLNIDPTDEDSWTFATPYSSGWQTRYQLFDENGNPDGACVLGNPACVSSTDFGPGSPDIVPHLTSLMFEDNGILRILPDHSAPTAIGFRDNADQIFDVLNGNLPQPVTIVEKAKNSGIFANYDESDLANLYVLPTAPYVSSGIIDYNDVGKSVVVKLVTQEFVAVQDGNWDDPATWGTIYPPTTTEFIDVVTIFEGTTVTIPPGVTVYHAGTIQNYGRIINDGTINNFGYLNNLGIFDNSGTVNNNGRFTNINVESSVINNHGTITNFGSGQFNNGNIVHNHGIINNDSTITNIATIENFQTIINNPTGVINNNAGTIYNRCGGTITQNGILNGNQIVDGCPPTIAAPADLTVEATGPLTNPMLGTPVASDDVDPSPTIYNNASPGFPVGSTVVTWYARDAAGNTSFDDQLVQITDNTPPTITILGDNPTTINVGSAYLDAGATAVDLVDGTTLVSTSGIVDTDTLGNYVITYTTTDSSGNTNTATRTVSVIQLIPTSITIDANQDSFIHTSKNLNEGANKVLLVQASGSKRSLVSFDLSGQTGKDIANAKLRLNVVYNGGNWGKNNDRTINIYALTAPWTEGNAVNFIPSDLNPVFAAAKTKGSGSGVTWNCANDTNVANNKQNCAISWNGASFVATPSDTKIITSTTSGWIEFDVTSDVQAILDGTMQNNGWIVKKTNEKNSGRIGFASSESNDFSIHPQLVLEFSP